MSQIRLIGFLISQPQQGCNKGMSGYITCLAFLMGRIIAEDEEQSRECTGEVTLSQPDSRSERPTSRMDDVEESGLVTSSDQQ